MTIKSLKILLATVLVFGSVSPAFAEDADDYSSSDNKYELAYNKCSDTADNQENEDQDWDDAFNNCMSKEGFGAESDNYEDTDSYQ